MVTLYHPIEQLQKLAKAANIPYSLAQLLQIGLMIIRNTRNFEMVLGECNKKGKMTKRGLTLKYTLNKPRPN